MVEGLGTVKGSDRARKKIRQEMFNGIRVFGKDCGIEFTAVCIFEALFEPFTNLCFINTLDFKIGYLHRDITVLAGKEA